MSSDSPAGAAGMWPTPHIPVRVAGDLVTAGAVTRRFRPGDARSLLTAYLALIRGVRDQRRARTIELRSADIDSLAAYLGLPGSEVVERLAELMGATRSQRATMVTLFGAGALVIGLAGSTAAVRAQPGPPARVEPPVVSAATRPAAPDAPATTTTTTAAAALTPAPSVTPAPSSAPEPVAAEPPTIVDQPEPTTAPRPAATSGPRVPNTADAPASTPAPDTTIVTDIGTPPIPPTTEPAADTTIVTDIGTPPIPPTTEPATDTTIVTDIGTPPVPPPMTTDALVS